MPKWLSWSSCQVDLGMGLHLSGTVIYEGDLEQLK